MRRLVKWLALTSLAGILLLAGIYMFVNSRQETAALNDAVRANAPGQFLQLDQGYVHYTLAGPDTGKLVILIHGGGTTGIEVWKHNIPWLLSNGYRVLAYDLYGRGYSDRPDLVYDLALYRRQLLQLLDTLDIEKPFDIVAMSMGASIALDFASANPARVKKIALLAPAASGDMRPSRMLQVPVLSDLLMTLYWYPRSVENQRREFVNQPLFDDYAKRLGYFMNFSGYKHLTHSTWHHMMNRSVLPLLKDIKPGIMMLIYGSQDVYFPDKNVPRYASLYPSMIVHCIDSSGHMPHYERPDKVNTLLTDFLQ